MKRKKDFKEVCSLDSGLFNITQYFSRLQRQLGRGGQWWQQYCCSKSRSCATCHWILSSVKNAGLFANLVL